MELRNFHGQLHVVGNTNGLVSWLVKSVVAVRLVVEIICVFLPELTVSVRFFEVRCETSTRWLGLLLLWVRYLVQKVALISFIAFTLLKELANDVFLLHSVIIKSFIKINI